MRRLSKRYSNWSVKYSDKEMAMRPVDKGEAPQVYAKYEDAKVDLVARLGKYCSYCERRIPTNLAVEHIQPKSLNPELETSWRNLLLACGNCNSSKGSKSVNPSDYLWPDCDNTLRAFSYSRGGLISPKSNLSPAMAIKAQASIALAGLDKTQLGTDRKSTCADDRWTERFDLWLMAAEYRRCLLSNDTLREFVVDLALASGMFSIWWTVFANDIDMRRRLREAFINTDASCFDADENLVARPGGQV